MQRSRQYRKPGYLQGRQKMLGQQKLRSKTSLQVEDFFSIGLWKIWKLVLKMFKGLVITLIVMSKVSIISPPVRKMVMEMRKGEVMRYECFSQCITPIIFIVPIEQKIVDYPVWFSLSSKSTSFKASSKVILRLLFLLMY